MKHGTLSSYNNHGCRCSDCRKAFSEYRNLQREWEAKLKEVQLPPGMTANEECGYCQGKCTHDLKPESEYEVPEKDVGPDIVEGFDIWDPDAQEGR